MEATQTNLNGRRIALVLFTTVLLGVLAGSQFSMGLQPTACSGEPTPVNAEGPYFKANSPERTSLLEQGMTGTKLLITGKVLATSCKPIALAKLDFWQADDKGVYDNEGYRLRGHQFTDKDGNYKLETILPAPYQNRPRHIHVKVQAPNEPVLTTQLYFPAEQSNQNDQLFNPKLVMTVQDTKEGQVATFNFVLAIKEDY